MRQSERELQRHQPGIARMANKLVGAVGHYFAVTEFSLEYAGQIAVRPEKPQHA